MTRKRPVEPKKPFFTVDPDLSRLLAEVQMPENVLPFDDHNERDERDWVDRADDELIEARPHLRQMAETVPRESIVLMRERIRATAKQNVLSETEFARKLAAEDDEGVSILDLLTREKALSKNGAKGTVSLAELYVFYCNYRWTSADELLLEFQTADGRARLIQIRDECVRLARELRWAVRLSECFADHPMPDEMRRLVLRGAGAVSPEQQGGWLGWVAEWLNEAAYRLQRPPGGVTNEKEKAFQLAWYEKARRWKPKNRVVLWEVGRRMFLLAFPSTQVQYTFADDYSHAVQQRLRKPKAKPPQDAET